jgi:hypothetical protein
MTTCRDCKFWHPLDKMNLKPEAEGECRESPPQVVVFPASANQIKIQGVWPRLSGLLGCGKHVKKLVII